MSRLSNYDVINPVEDTTRMLCFHGAVIGLKYHDNLAITIPENYSILDFKQFLRDAYDLKIINASKIKKQPVLVLISRNGSRIFTNEDKMVVMIEELGFRVMIGAHGAGLTNAVFLPAGAVVVQVVPLGLDWASTAYFGDPLSKMDVHYLEYKITPEESSLVDLYGRDDPVFSKGYYAARAVYVDGQNLKIDLLRFRETLVQAVRLLEQ